MSWLIDAMMNLTLVLVLIRVILNGAEALASRKEYASTGLYAWPVRRLRHSWMTQGTLGDLLNLALQYPRYLYLVALQSLCAIGLLSPALRRTAPFLLLFVLAIEFLSLIRNGGYGTEGSDQMHLILLCLMPLYFATADPLVHRAVIWFIALQSMLIYFTAGVVKLQTRQWISGTAIQDVLNTDSYGSQGFASWLKKAPRLSHWMCWGVIAFECSFPFAILAGPHFTLGTLIGGAILHLMIAATMGLNGFFWSFVATYPAVFLFSFDFESLVHSHRLLT